MSSSKVFQKFRFRDKDLKPEYQAYAIEEIKKLRTRPCVACILDSENWVLQFNNNFEKALLRLNGKLLGTHSGFRTHRVKTNSVKFEGEEFFVKFPPAIQIPEFIDLANVLFSSKAVRCADYSSVLLWFLILRVHPFSDGNGRTARALLAIARSQWVLTEEAFLIPTAVYKANNDWITYYLWHATTEKNIAELFDYLLELYYRTLSIE